MSAAVTLAQLLTSIQRRANIENQAGFVTLPEQREYINEYCAQLWDLLIEARSQEHTRKAQTITTVNGTSAYSLASDFYQLLSVDIQIAPNQFLTARPYMEGERNIFRLYPAWAGWFYSMPVYYRILGSSAHGGGGVTSVAEKQINFIPGPQAAYPVTVNYYPAFPPFALDGSQDSNVFNGVNGWEQYVIWGAVLNIKQKLKEDASFAAARFAAMQERIEGLAAQNDAGNAERIHDVMADYDTGWWVP